MKGPLPEDVERVAITQEYIASRFEYRNGELIWKPLPPVTPRNRAFNIKYAGKIAGWPVGGNNRLAVNLEGKQKYVHRLIYLLHHGHMPDEIDHIDRNPRNNRIENLRSVTRGQNTQNSAPRRGISKYKGVHKISNYSKWIAEIHVDGKRIRVANCETEIEAAAAYNIAARKYFGQQAYINPIPIRAMQGGGETKKRSPSGHEIGCNIEIGWRCDCDRSR